MLYLRLVSLSMYESSNLSFKIENVSILSGFAKQNPKSSTVVFGLGFSFCLSFIVKNPPMRR